MPKQLIAIYASLAVKWLDFFYCSLHWRNCRGCIARVCKSDFNNAIMEKNNNFNLNGEM